MKIESAVFGEKHNKIGSRLSYHQDSKIMKGSVIYLNWHKELELIMVEKGRLLPYHMIFETFLCFRLMFRELVQLEESHSEQFIFCISCSFCLP